MQCSKLLTLLRNIKPQAAELATTVSHQSWNSVQLADSKYYSVPHCIAVCCRNRTVCETAAMKVHEAKLDTNSIMCCHLRCNLYIYRTASSRVCVATIAA